MQFHQSLDTFTGERAWEARTLGEVEGASVRVHWTDQPYRWHVNDGAEVFLVLAGIVEMHWRDTSGEHKKMLNAGDACFAQPGDEHVAHPHGVARILVVERKGSA